MTVGLVQAAQTGRPGCPTQGPPGDPVMDASRRSAMVVRELGASRSPGAVPETDSILGRVLGNRHSLPAVGLRVPWSLGPAGMRVTAIGVTLIRSRVFRVSGRVVNAPAAARLTVLMSDAKNARMRDYLIRNS